MLFANHQERARWGLHAQHDRHHGCGCIFFTCVYVTDDRAVMLQNLAHELRRRVADTDLAGHIGRLPYSRAFRSRTHLGFVSLSVSTAKGTSVAILVRTLATTP